MELVNLQKLLYTFDIEKKGVIVLVHAMEVCKGIEGIDPLIFTSVEGGDKW
jgi:hypothetical protein